MCENCQILEARIKELEEQLEYEKQRNINNVMQADERIKELEEEKKGMIKLSEADMKKLGWSYT